MNRLTVQPVMIRHEEARMAPGLAFSTTKVTRVSIGAPGFETYGTTRKSEVKRAGVSVHRVATQIIVKPNMRIPG